ncbi:MAG TPA: TetR/AcrR family transcriptional regulator [Solirubrobacterales bacterium]|jgi:AcrR family transcriptional regulator|nr:TetR/AcrR family transcriptional regulator [Solirubrobacterales bacterium]
MSSRDGKSVGGPIERGRTESERQRWTTRRAEVIDTAAELFAAQGYHATSIDDLVKATGLQRGGLYHYMGSKKDLLIQIHERFIMPLLAEAQEIAAIDQPAIEAVRQLGRALMSDIAEYQDQVTVFLHEWRAVEDDAAWADIRKARKEFEDVVAGVLRRGEKEKAFRLGRRRLTVLAFLGMINYSYQWYDPTGSVAPDKIADEFSSIFLDGITV